MAIILKKNGNSEIIIKQIAVSDKLDHVYKLSNFPKNDFRLYINEEGGRVPLRMKDGTFQDVNGEILELLQKKSVITT